MKTRKQRGPKPGFSRTLDAAVLVRALVKHGWKWAAAELAVHNVTGVPLGNIRKYLRGPIEPIPESLDKLAAFALAKNGWTQAARQEQFPKAIAGQ
ncbi:MAG: hypothetical protein FJ189_06710 [Gammaproteobacteria bacterium]|nr:hypothetical protein [Gammaproteobacteria bacterium]